MFIKKAREFTGLWVFDKWKGYLNKSVKNKKIQLEYLAIYIRIILLIKFTVLL